MIEAASVVDENILLPRTRQGTDLEFDYLMKVRRSSIELQHTRSFHIDVERCASCLAFLDDLLTAEVVAKHREPALDFSRVARLESRPNAP